MAALMLAAGVAAGCAACGGNGTPSTPPACGLLSDGDIQAVTHLAPTSEGGGGTAARSTCVWALPNTANGSISLLLIRCGASCPGVLASLAPSPAFADTGTELGPGVTGRLGSASIAAQQDRAVIEITADHPGVNLASALPELARRALGHLT